VCCAQQPFTLISDDAALTPAPREQVEKKVSIVQLTLSFTLPASINVQSVSPLQPLTVLSQSTTLHVPTASVVSTTVTISPIHYPQELPLLPFLLHFHLHFQIPYHTPDSNADPKSFTFDSRRREVMRLRTCHVGVMNFSGNISSKFLLSPQFASELHQLMFLLLSWQPKITFLGFSNRGHGQQWREHLQAAKSLTLSRAERRNEFWVLYKGTIYTEMSS